MFFKKSKIFEDFFFVQQQKKYSLFLNIRHKQFDQNKISLFFKKSENFINIFFAKKKNVFLLVLPFEVISLQPELSSSAHFRIQGCRLSVTYIGAAAAAAAAGVVAEQYFSFLI